MSDWAVTVLFRGTIGRSGIARIEDSLPEASAADVPEAGQATVTVHVTAESALVATAAVLSLVTQVMEGRLIVGLEVLDEAEYERRATLPTTPELVGASEAAELLGVTRQRVHQLHATHAGFPEPLIRVRMGPLWDRRAVEAFARRSERRPRAAG